MLIIGEINGKHELLYKIIQDNCTTEKYCIIAGNLGISARNIVDLKAQLSHLDAYCSEQKVKLYCNRGNEDNPKFFDRAYYHEFESITLVEDRDIIEIDGNNTVFIGGGLSVDKAEKKRRGIYWEHEALKAEYSSLKSLKTADVAVSYKPVPYLFDDMYQERYIEHWVKQDACIENQLSQERDILSRLFKLLSRNNPLKYWLSTHLDVSSAITRKETIFVSVKAGDTQRI